MKYKYIKLLVIAVISVAIAFASIHYSYHYSTQKVTEVQVCNGSYIPESQIGGLCQAATPSKVVSVKIRQKDNSWLEYVGLSAATLVLAIGVLRTFRKS